MTDTTTATTDTTTPMPMQPTSITLAGEKHFMHATFEAISSIEHELDAGVIALARKLVGGMLTLEELVVIICKSACLDAHIVRQALTKGGIKHAFEAVAQLFAHALADTEQGITRTELYQLMEKYPDAKTTVSIPSPIAVVPTPPIAPDALATPAAAIAVPNTP